MNKSLLDSGKSACTAMPIDSSRQGVSGRNGSLLTGLAVSSVLLPVHPSVQGALYELGVPSALLFLILFIPCALWAACQMSFQRRQFLVILSFAVYGIWLVLTSAYSPAVGLENWIGSVRSLMVLLPCVLVAALVAAKSEDTAAKVVVVCGVVAFVHYFMLFMLGRAGGEEGGSGFGAIATIDGVQNYQATSYYVGICGISLLAAFRAQRIGFWVAFFGCAVVFVVMATIGARASLVGLAFVFGLVLATSPFTRLIFLILLVALLGLVLLVVQEGLAAYLNSDSIIRSLTALERFRTLAGDDDLSHRIRLFSSAIELWLRSPATLIFGAGLGSFPFYTGQIDEKGWYPHNFLLESLAEGGVVAILPLFLLALSSLGRYKCANGMNDFATVFIFYFALYSFVAYMFMGGIVSVWIPFFPWALFLLTKVKYVKCE